MSEKKSGVNYVHNQAGPLEKIGVLASVPTHHLGAGTWDSIGKEISPDRIQELKERLKDVEWQGDVEVHLNKSSIMRQLERLFDENRDLSLFSRVVFGIPSTVGYGILGKLANWNYYNPYTETVQLYNENEYINLAKIGSAEVFDKMEGGFKKELLALMNSIPGLGNTIPNTMGIDRAWKHIDEEEEDIAIKYLGSSFVNDVAMDVLSLGTVLSVLKVVNPLTSFLVAGGAALGVQGVLELRRRIRENKKKLFDRNSDISQLLEKQEQQEVSEQLIHLAT